MFGASEKTAALDLARRLAARDYAGAHQLLSAGARSRTSVEALREQFESVIPLDWGEVDPVELEQNPAWDSMFVYVVLGGAVYSEALIVSAFVTEGGETRIEAFELGRP